jgi:endonuclease/exonuclease/phosphatase family metal-dependent hydrolase
VNIKPDKEVDLLEVGEAPKLRLPEAAPAEIKLVSYNIRWRGGEDLRKLIELLRGDAEIGKATVIGLQEVDRHKKRTGNVNTARLMAEALGMYYAWAAPPRTKAKESEDETGVAILSAFPLRDVERIVMPHPGPEGRRRVALGATVEVGKTSIRVYSVHAETRIPVERKIDQLRSVLEAIKKRPQGERAIVLGDFNTIKGKDVRATIKLFTEAGFSTPFPHDRPTWRFFLLKLKLDWMWLSGLQTTESNIVRRIGLSDHWPLWVRAKLTEAK